MRKWGREVEPILIGDSNTSAPFQPTIREIKYNVAVVYTTQDGRVNTFTGSFLGRNTAVADERARAFITKYKRPKTINEVKVEVF